MCLCLRGLDQEDYKAAQGDAADDSDDVDYFRDVSDGKDTLKYEDFFDPPRREECIDSESDDNGEELFSSEIEDECNKRLTSESEKDNSVDEDTPNVHLSTYEKKLKKVIWCNQIIRKDRIVGFFIDLQPMILKTSHI